MKKLFMLAVAAGLAFGMASCANDPKEGPANRDGNAAKAGLKISFALPKAGNNTRATDRTPIPGTTDESSPANVYVYVFNADGTAAEIGSYTELAVGSDFAPPVGGVYDMNEAIEVAAGSGMKVWVAIDLPTPHGYATETALLADIAQVADMSVGVGEFAMFSNGASELDLVAGEDNEDLTGTNAVTLDRVVSKVVATNNVAELKVAWTNVEMIYTTEHYFIIRDAHESWLAPRYDVAAYNDGATYLAAYDTDGQPATYKGLNFAALNTYGESVIRIPGNADSGKYSFATTSDQNETNIYYLGENASLEESGKAAAKNGNTTYAFISTTVNVNNAAEWDDANDEIIWEEVAGGYGKGTSDVFVVRTAEYGDVVTDDLNKAKDIEYGIAEVSAAILNIHLTLDGVDDGDTTNGTEMTTADFLEDYPEYDAKIFKYSDGYVHFMHWLNKIEDNQYDVLRNQYIVLDIVGINAVEGIFPGYPGQDDDLPNKDTDGDGTPDDEDDDIDGDGIPNDDDDDDDGDGIPDEDDDDDSEIPGDPTDIDDPNNPDPEDPTDPVDPEKSGLLIDVKINPWTYRVNSVTLE